MTEVVELTEFINNTFTSIKVYDDCVDFKNDTQHFRMEHQQDCCECVEVEDVCGDIETLINFPIIHAEVVSEEDPYASESGTWTFYKFTTVVGNVTIRWYGASNGYYSERVSIYDFVNHKVID